MQSVRMSSWEKVKHTHLLSRCHCLEIAFSGVVSLYTKSDIDIRSFLCYHLSIHIKISFSIASPFSNHRRPWEQSLTLVTRVTLLHWEMSQKDFTDAQWNLYNSIKVARDKPKAQCAWSALEFDRTLQLMKSMVGQRPCPVWRVLKKKKKSMQDLL